MISIVIPIFNEADSIERLYREIDATLSTLPGRAEIIWIDDGSSDGAQHILARLMASDNRVRMVRHPCNLGKSAAYTSGFCSARGDTIVTLDGDLQDDPQELPRFLARLNEGADIVIGWKQKRMKNEFGKAVPSRVFNWMLKKVFGLDLQDSNCGFRAMQKDVADSLVLYGGFYRFIPEIAHAKGFRVDELKIAHRKRVYGSSKYGLTRFWTSLFDILALRFTLSFLDRPLQIFGSVALIFMLAGAGLESYVLIQKFLGSAFQAHIAALVTGVFLMIVGIQILAVGLVGVMLAAHWNNSRERRSETRIQSGNNSRDNA